MALDKVKHIKEGEVPCSEISNIISLATDYCVPIALHKQWSMG